MPHQFYQLDSWLRILRANASEKGRSANLKTVPAAFLIYCYSEGVSPSIEALEAYAQESPSVSASCYSLKNLSRTTARG
jgi:hypothetical protein